MVTEYDADVDLEHPKRRRRTKAELEASGYYDSKPPKDTAPKADSAPKPRKRSNKRLYRELIGMLNEGVKQTPYAPLALATTEKPVEEKPIDEVDAAATLVDTVVQNVPFLSRLAMRGVSLGPWAPAIIAAYRLLRPRLQTVRLLQLWQAHVREARAAGMLPYDFQTWLSMVTNQAEGAPQPPPQEPTYGNNGSAPRDPIMSGAVE